MNSSDIFLDEARRFYAGFRINSHQAYFQELQHRHHHLQQLRTGAMDPRLWSLLPDDIVERILAWLPAEDFLRLRHLCRRWAALPSCRSFRDVCSRVPSQGTFFVKSCAADHQHLTAFSPAANRWYKIPLAFLPPPAAGGLPIAAAAGLLCFTNPVSYSDEYTALFVCNPLTRAWRELPPMLFHPRPTLVSMVPDTAGGNSDTPRDTSDKTHGESDLPRGKFDKPRGNMDVLGGSSRYKIVVAGRWTTEVYSSATGSWRRSACLPRGEEVSRNVALCNGVLYCLTPRWYNCSLLAYSPRHDAWIKIKTGRLPGYCQFRNLVECSGHVAIVGKCVRHQVFTVCVWFLDQRSLKWREVGRMPKAMAEHFLVMPSESFHCAGVKNLVFLTRDNSPHGILFDIGTKSWRWVHDCPNLEGMGFEPRLDAVP